jgi:hypothetical protein
MAQTVRPVLSRTIGPSRTAPFVGLHLHLRVDVLGDRSETRLGPRGRRRDPFCRKSGAVSNLVQTRASDRRKTHSAGRFPVPQLERPRDPSRLPPIWLVSSVLVRVSVKSPAMRGSFIWTASVGRPRPLRVRPFVPRFPAVLNSAFASRASARGHRGFNQAGHRKLNG